LLIFDVSREAGIAPSSSPGLGTRHALHVSDVLVHDETAFRDFRRGRSKR
jgi:hypothetical protein